MGLPADGRWLDESCEFNLPPQRFPYGYSKHLAEIEVRQAVAAGLPAVIVNPTAAIGPRDVNRLSGAIILEAAHGRLWACLPGGLNFIAVEDVIAGHLAAAERSAVGERYILAGENLSYQTVFEIVCQVVGRRPPKIVLSRWMRPAAAVLVAAARATLGNRVPLGPEHVRLSAHHIFADGRKAVAAFKLSRTPFHRAVRRAYKWYLENGYL